MEKISKISSGIMALVALVVLTVLSFGFVMNLDKKAYGDVSQLSIIYTQGKSNFTYANGDKTVNIPYANINVVFKLYSTTDNSLKYSAILKSPNQTLTSNLDNGTYIMHIEAPVYANLSVAINDVEYKPSGTCMVTISAAISIEVVLNSISQETWFNNSTTI